jgi:hypothetical protein
MESIAFKSLPRTVRIAALATFFIGWVLFAELIIDRHGLGAWLPFYRVGNLCPYDIAVLAMLAWAWVRLNR